MVVVLAGLVGLSIGVAGVLSAAPVGASRGAAVSRGKGPDVAAKKKKKKHQPKEKSATTVRETVAPPTTAWQVVLDQIPDDGQVSTATALAAFSLAIGPLPGVALPAGDSEPVASGSGAVRWLLAHMDELSTDQQAAARTLLGGPGVVALHTAYGGPIGGGIQLASLRADGPGAEPYRVLVDQAKTTIASRLGRTLHGGVSVVVETIDALKRSGNPHATAEAFTVPHNAQGEQTGSMAQCTIHVNPSGTFQAIPEKQVRANMTHELMHCFIYDVLPIENALILPSWIGEAIPGWVGESIVGGTDESKTWWNRYITTPLKGLFGRTYDAIGFYSHLAESGVDPWKYFDKMVQAGSSDAAFKVAVAARGDAFFETWPTGYARNPAFGTHWDMTGPGITAATPPPVRSTIENGQTLRDQVNEAANNFSTVDLQADVIRFEILGYGSIRTEDGREAPVSALYGNDLCTLPKGCACPIDSPGSHVRFGKIPKGPILLGVTGGADAAAFAIVGLSVEEFCHTKPNTTVPGVVGPPPTTCLCPDFGFPKHSR